VSREIVIASRRVGAGHRPYIVAELSANHLGGIERAFAIMTAAKHAGAGYLLPYFSALFIIAGSYHGLLD
jgi:hypothetical protein